MCGCAELRGYGATGRIYTPSLCCAFAWFSRSWKGDTLVWLGREMRSVSGGGGIGWGVPGALKRLLWHGRKLVLMKCFDSLIRVFFLLENSTLK